MERLGKPCPVRGPWVRIPLSPPGILFIGQTQMPKNPRILLGFFCGILETSKYQNSLIETDSKKV
jgi:hypothetical protein